MTVQGVLHTVPEVAGVGLLLLHLLLLLPLLRMGPQRRAASAPLSATDGSGVEAG